MFGMAEASSQKPQFPLSVGEKSAAALVTDAAQAGIF
jgi:hypothetical protein